MGLPKSYAELSEKSAEDNNTTIKSIREDDITSILDFWTIKGYNHRTNHLIQYSRTYKLNVTRQ